MAGARASNSPQAAAMLLLGDKRLSERRKKLSAMIARLFEPPNEPGMRIAEGIPTQHAQHAGCLSQTRYIRSLAVIECCIHWLVASESLLAAD